MRRVVQTERFASAWMSYENMSQNPGLCLLLNKVWQWIYI